MPRAPWASTRSARPRSWPDARRFAAALAAAAAFAAIPAAADFTARVVSVADGDSMTLRNGAREVHVRLWGIDAPERGQPWSKRARDALVARALHRDARVVERGIDSYGRTLARVSVGGVDLAEAQLRDGWAWVFRRYTDDASLLALEADARAARRGLWSDRDPEPPWRFRERTKPAGDAPPKRP
jgi:endonuclease YncB( thermonuclease family)